jgi:hypothetical protein
VHTPRFCGHSFNAGAEDLRTSSSLRLRTNWLMVGMQYTSFTEYFKD